MFFSISKFVDTRYPCSDRLGHWVFNHDIGWLQKDHNSWFKGYYYAEITHGNYCSIKFEDNVIVIDHDRERSFPLWWDDQRQILTNCLGTGQRLWTDDKVSLGIDSIRVQKTDVIGEIDCSTVSYEHALEQIRANLSSKFDHLKKESLPKKLFLSGGVDTLALFSEIKNHDIECEYIDHEYFYYDSFCNQFISQIREDYWAYKQLHHWPDPCLLITGGCGDEYTLRGPDIIAHWLAWHNIDFIPYIEKNNGYHCYHFAKQKNVDLFRYHYNNRKTLRSQYPEKKDMVRYLVDKNLNDHQHWHLGNTLTWTPFKDIEMFKLLLRVDVEEILCQLIDAKLSRDLIGSRYRNAVSQQKNLMSRSYLDQIMIS